MRMARLATAFLGTALLVGAICLPAEANIRRLRSSYSPGEVIVAHSLYGNGSISSVVRPGRFGWQVRLPGGAWTDCRRSCEETLRVQTVDLTAREDGSLAGYGTFQRECGIFGCLHWEYSF